MTALGDVQIRRSFASCPHCHLTCFPADPLLGIDGWMTRRALRMAVRVGILEPFRKAEGLLADLLGWSVDADTLRRRCHEQAQSAAAQRAERTALPEAFSQADGNAEVHIDAGKFFGTDKQWHDIKLGVVLVRPPGQPSDPTGFAQRGLPAPIVRSVVAGVQTRQEFGPRVAAEVGRLKLPAGEGLSVLGDGAEWIWNLAGEHFPETRQVLDYWHAAEHLASAGRPCFAGSQDLSVWLSGAKQSLAADGYSGVCLSLLEASKGEPLGEGLVKELNYFAGHQGRMNYALRLHRGQSIGSGAVEGAIKQLVNLRLKRTAARWDVDRVGDFVQLLAQADTAEWHEHWASLAG